jgi:hypothetical protein
MALRFKLPLSVRITIAARRYDSARKAYEKARALTVQCEREANLPDGERPPFAALTWLAALAAEGEPRRAMWDAEDRLRVLNGMWPVFDVPAPRHAV